MSEENSNTKLGGCDGTRHLREILRVQIAQV